MLVSSEIFFFCANSFSGLGAVCSFSVQTISVAGESHVGVDLTISSVILSGLCSPSCTQWPEILHLNPKAHHYPLHLLSICSKNSACFFGHWLCVQLHCPAWAHVPVPPTIIMAHGTCDFWRMTSFIFLVAFLDMHTLDFLGGYMRILTVNTKIWTSWIVLLWGFQGQWVVNLFRDHLRDHLNAES